MLVWDNEGAVGRGGKLTAEFAALAGLLGVRIFQTRPRDPEANLVLHTAPSWADSMDVSVGAGRWPGGRPMRGRVNSGPGSW